MCVVCVPVCWGYPAEGSLHRPLTYYSAVSWKKSILVSATSKHTRDRGPGSSPESSSGESSPELIADALLLSLQNGLV